jgi:hypothetical protein
MGIYLFSKFLKQQESFIVNLSWLFSSLLGVTEVVVSQLLVCDPVPEVIRVHLILETDSVLLLDGILWAARLLFIIPMLLIPVGMWKQYPCEDIYELIEEQYGIRFEDKVNPDDLGYRITNQKLADDNFGNPKKAAEEPAKVNNE